jgi:hypothetical protein
VKLKETLVQKRQDRLAPLKFKTDEFKDNRKRRFSGGTRVSAALTDRQDDKKIKTEYLKGVINGESEREVLDSTEAIMVTHGSA